MDLSRLRRLSSVLHVEWKNSTFIDTNYEHFRISTDGNRKDWTLMRNQEKRYLAGLVMFVLFIAGQSCLYASSTAPSSLMTVFNVKDYGATGKKTNDAGPAIQKAIDAEIGRAHV